MSRNTDNMQLPDVLIHETSRAALRQKFAALPGTAELHVYHEDSRDVYTRFSVQSARELGESSDKIKVFFHSAAGAAALHGPAGLPSLVVQSGGAPRPLLRLMGAPIGLEGVILTKALALAAGDESDLSQKARAILDELEDERDILIFTSNTCPYCPGQTVLAMDFVLYRPELINLCVVAAGEFRELAARYAVSGVPHSVVNGADQVFGPQQDAPFAEMVLKLKHQSIGANIDTNAGFTPGDDDIFGFGAAGTPVFMPAESEAGEVPAPQAAPVAQTSPASPPHAADDEDGDWLFPPVAEADFASFNTGAGPAPEQSGEDLGAPRNKRDQGDEFNRDLLILGGGPAGLTAAVYAARSGLSVTVLDSGMLGGQVNLTPLVENYPGLASRSGALLAFNFVEHAKLYAQLRGNLQIGDPVMEGGKFKVETSNGDYRGRALLLATGSRWRKLGIPGEAEYAGAGVHNCASCDGYLYAGKKVAVVGGGNTAITDALHLKNLGADVTIVHRRDSFRGEEALARAIEKSGIRVAWDSAPVAVLGQGGKAAGLRIRNNKTNAETELPVQGVFVSIGLIPNSGPAAALGANLDKSGYIAADGNMRTNVPKLYAAGDVVGGYLQIVTAVARGAQAAHAAFLDLQQAD
ncbi:MAG: FAD-dependent oxidoreductase [Deltaproteobacteria bacterium]|jgi:thioredoxin reductase|nr:FAD-dependent oxidoreductase [Deltaproteobacteria bacterium]